jgi:heptaprenyl diphosphate synthase
MLGVFTAMAMVLSYVEAILPINFGIPGMKLGLANLITVIILYKVDFKCALTVSVLRIVLSGFLFGNLFSIVYSLSGGLLSLFAMTLAKKIKLFSVCGVSILGGVMHNVGQLIVAVIILESFNLTYYLPMLLVSGLITGMLIGVISGELIKRTREFHLNKLQRNGD